MVLGKNTDVFTDHLRAVNINHMAVDHFDIGQRVMAKIRYNHEGAPATIKEIGNDSIDLIFEEPVRAVTPGLALVMYEGDYVLGGGTIVKFYK